VSAYLPAERRRRRRGPCPSLRTSTPHGTTCSFRPRGCLQECAVQARSFMRRRGTRKARSILFPATFLRRPASVGSWATTVAPRTATQLPAWGLSRPARTTCFLTDSATELGIVVDASRATHFDTDPHTPWHGSQAPPRCDRGTKKRGGAPHFRTVAWPAAEALFRSVPKECRLHSVMIAPAGADRLRDYRVFTSHRVRLSALSRKHWSLGWSSPCRTLPRQTARATLKFRIVHPRQSGCNEICQLADDPGLAGVE